MIKIKHLVFVISALILACQSSEKNSSEVSKTENKVVTKVDIADIEKGIKAYIKNKTKEADGYFHVKDENKELRLKLVRVHTEYLSNLGPNRHFACVDLADENGDVYDVDFFMEGKPGAMDVTETTVHKLNGKPFYSWKQKEDKTWHRVPIESASNELLGVIEGEDEFEFYYETTLPKIENSAKVWIPIAQSDKFQDIEIKSMQIYGEDQILEEEKYGNKVLFLKLDKVDSEKKVRISYHVKRKEKSAYEEKGTDINQYLNENILMPVGTARFKEIVNEATAGMENDNQLIQARAIYDYIIDNMRYAKNIKYGTGDAVYACDSKTGNCTEFHSLFISLARTANIPARFAIGAGIPSDRNEGGINGYHCWAEFYAEGKWWPVDISEGNKYTALATYYFGRHPANRIEFTKGRDLIFEPSPKSSPVKFMAYPIFEVDGESIVSNAKFSFQRITDNSEKL
ncbi:transglutaminase domain-containing protein [Marivirga arenosa]|uniref:Transglutaminase domain-containing protein n=1 Tax=Marivirga arenosa TaxID=3059076 RepID=A0AA51N5G1_9BACT|nr:transglutaminase domain-containing protein [Marivirga sp. ABR2-2]WMN06656.1 transglutaminase domain-containing protein [Marivirga sp. ABR2-2]